MSGKARTKYKRPKAKKVETTPSEVAVRAGRAERPPAHSSVSSDAPINNPDQDLYGIQGFAKAMARTISNADASDGLVLSINGPWGSGKSSACNLILHYLRKDTSARHVVPISFNPWWFSSAESLTYSFFHELGASIGQTVSGNINEIFDSIAQTVSPAGPLLGSIATIVGGPALGGAVGAGVSYAKHLVRKPGTLDQQHARLSDALRGQDKRFLVVIDDIDRLGTDDALQMFRLVKSVGKLPNVIYLLAFDRLLAERMVAERFPSEGPSYLEKIIQGPFDLPSPDPDDLRESVLLAVQSVMGSPGNNKIVRFHNLFHDVVAPFIRTPRDTVRIENAIRVSWPAIADEVDRADFLALEAIRIFLPKLYVAIRAHPEMLCGLEPQSMANRDGIAERYNAIFLQVLEGRDKEIALKALRRLFPRAETVWSNVWYSEVHRGWRQDRLICSEAHFPTYFSFSVHEGAITASELEELLQAVESAEQVAALLKRMVTQKRRRGGTRAALALEELSVWSDRIDNAHIPQLLEGIFEVADDIDVACDDGGVFAFANNHLRIHWLLNFIVRDRFDQQTRSELIEAACKRASLGWLLDICGRCVRDHSSDPNRNNASDDREPLVTSDAANRLTKLALSRVREAAEDGALLSQRRLLSVLYSWEHMTGASEVCRWSESQLQNNHFVVCIADKAIQRSWSQGLGGFGGMGDVVARANDYVKVDSLSRIIDVDAFKRRVDELLASPTHDVTAEERAKLERYRSTPEADPEKRDYARLRD